MDNELDAVACRHSNLKKLSCLIASNEDNEIIVCEDSDRMSVCVQHLAIGNPVFSGTLQNYRIHLSSYLDPNMRWCYGRVPAAPCGVSPGETTQIHATSLLTPVTV